MSIVKTFGAKVNNLSPERQQEVMDFIDFLSGKVQSRQEQRIRKGFSFNWAGKLSDIKDKFTSVGFQHKILEWW